MPKVFWHGTDRRSLLFVENTIFAILFQLAK